jgi:hypothetical protein
MSVTHPTASRDAIAEAMRTIVNAGSTPILVIGTSALSGASGVLASITIPDFGASSAGVITSASTGSNAVASAAGTAAKAEVRSSGGTVGWAGSVGVGSGDVQISSTTIAVSDTVTVTGNTTYTAPV